MKTHLLRRHLIFLNLLELQTFCAFNINHSNPNPKISNLSNFICYFYAFNDFLTLNVPGIEKQYKWTLKRLKLGMVSYFHPHSMWLKVERVTAKTGCTSCTNCTIFFEVWGFQTKTHMLQRHFIFLTYVNSRLFVHSICTIPIHILKFQPFLTSFAIFMHLIIFFALNDLKLEKTSKFMFMNFPKY